MPCTAIRGHDNRPDTLSKDPGVLRLIRIGIEKYRVSRKAFSDASQQPVAPVNFLGFYV
jgi:hypothetical protein